MKLFCKISLIGMMICSLSSVVHGWPRAQLKHGTMGGGGGSQCVAGNTAQTVLLIHSNTTEGSVIFTDSGKNVACPHGINVQGGVHHTTAYTFPGFGSSSIYFPGNVGDYLNSADSASWDLGAGDFCVRVKLNFGGAVTSGGIIGRYAAEVNTWAINYNSGAGRLEWYYDNGSAYNFAWVPAINMPYTVAFSRIGGTLRCWVDGVQVGADTADAHNYNTNKQLVIGDYAAAGADPFQGYMTEIKIDVGDGTDYTPHNYPYCD